MGITLEEKLERRISREGFRDVSPQMILGITAFQEANDTFVNSFSIFPGIKAAI